MRKFLKIVGLLVILAAAIGIFVWYQFFRELPQPASITDDPRSNFLYGSIGGEGEAGIPYWIIIALPQMFPEYLPGPGGYASLGLPRVAAVRNWTFCCCLTLRLFRSE
jgi:hypothetical protein